ncbi:MAG: hypothetical protein FWD93_00920 [Coriobacteriia bacterium]|nr:hypothetical protein [Coriobacteriia bacterium]
MQEPQKIEIRRPLLGNILLILACSAFVAICVLILRLELGDAFERFIAIVGIIFFGGGGLFFVIAKMRKPIVIVSSKGITVSYGWGENFVRWKDVERFEIVTQSVRGTKHKHVAIFAPKAKGIVGAGAISQTATEVVTGWEEAPTLLIGLSFSFIKPEVIVGTLQEFHDRYKAARDDGA